MNSIDYNFDIQRTKRSTDLPAEIKKPLERSIDDLANEKMVLYKADLASKFDHELSVLRLQAEQAEKNASRAKWIAVASVVVTVVVVILAIIFL